MRVIFDELGVALADVAAQSYVDSKLTSMANIHVSNAMTIDVLRATLVKMPIASRPEITWIFYGKEVHFDNDLRSHDAWHDSRSNVHDAALSDLIFVKAGS